MTLIATFSTQNFPILFGDLLLTGQTLNDNVVSVPAAGEVQNFFGEDSGWSVRGLRQKVNLIDDRCAVAWTGGINSAKTAIEALRKMSKKGTLTFDVLVSYLRDTPQFMDDGFVGLFASDEELHYFHIRSAHLKNSVLGDSFYAGSGSLAFEEFASISTNASIQITGNGNPFAVAISQGLTLGGLLLNQEMRAGLATQTILNMFGGGYELAFFANGKMQKLQEITYLFWRANLTDAGVQISAPDMLLKQQYIRDCLVVRSSKFESSGQKMKAVDDQRHVVTPLFETDIPTKAEVEEVKFYSPLLCHCIVVTKDQQHLGIYNRVQQCGVGEDAPFSFEEHGDKVIFGFASQVMYEIARALEKLR